ncbi:MAG: ABC transporter substrate-binding protein [Saprospiraceae bacterium]
MARLTTFSKLLIVFLVVGAAVFGLRYAVNSGMIGDKTDANGGIFKSDNNTSSSSSRKGDAIRIGVVTWGGYAGGQYFNEGFAASEASRFSKEYGIDVEFVLNDDVNASLNAWKAGDLDLHWYTIDAFPTIQPGLAAFNPVVVFQSDWSRGGDAIVVRRGINSVADLKGKKIAVAELTPSHSFLIWLLDAGGLSINDVEVVKQASAIDAAAAFKSQQVDAAVVWSPDDELSLRAVPGSRVLESTRSASNIIADIFFAKREYVDANRDKLQKLYEGWMRGAAEINSSGSAKNKAAKILSEGLGIPEADAVAAINNVRLVTHGDNQNFFGLNTSFNGVTGAALYRRMGAEYGKLGVIEGSLPDWRQIAVPSLVQRTSLSGASDVAEADKSFAKVEESQAKNLEAIASKPVSISFRTGEHTWMRTPNTSLIKNLWRLPKRLPMPVSA